MTCTILFPFNARFFFMGADIHNTSKIKEIRLISLFTISINPPVGFG